MEVFEMVMQMERQDGREKQKVIFTENMLRSTDFSDEIIAPLAEVPPAFVAEKKAKLLSNRK